MWTNTLNVALVQVRETEAGRWTPAEISQHPRLLQPSVRDGRGPVHIHRLIETKTCSAAELCPGSALAPHLHVQLQDVGVCLQQLTHIGLSPPKVSVDKLFNVTVGGCSGSHIYATNKLANFLWAFREILTVRSWLFLQTLTQLSVDSKEAPVERIRPCLRLQAQVEVVSVHKPGAHTVDDPLTHGQGSPMQNPERRLLVQSQILNNRRTLTMM